MVDHVNVRFGHVSAKWLRQTAVNPERREPRDPLANHVRRDAGSGPDLQYIVTKFTGCLIHSKKSVSNICVHSGLDRNWRWDSFMEAYCIL